MQAIVYRSSLKIDHRSSGFICHGTANFLIRASDREAPRMDVLCSKCHSILELDLEHSDADPADAKGIAAAGRLLIDKANELRDATCLVGDGLIADPAAPLLGANAPVQAEAGPATQAPDLQ